MLSLSRNEHQVVLREHEIQPSAVKIVLPSWRKPPRSFAHGPTTFAILWNRADSKGPNAKFQLLATRSSVLVKHSVQWGLIISTSTLLCRLSSGILFIFLAFLWIWDLCITAGPSHTSFLFTVKLWSPLIPSLFDSHLLGCSHPLAWSPQQPRYWVLVWLFRSKPCLFDHTKRKNLRLVSLHCTPLPKVLSLFCMYKDESSILRIIHYFAFRYSWVITLFYLHSKVIILFGTDFWMQVAQYNFVSTLCRIVVSDSVPLGSYGQYFCSLKSTYFRNGVNLDGPTVSPVGNGVMSKTIKIVIYRVWNHETLIMRITCSTLPSGILHTNWSISIILFMPFRVLARLL